MIYQGVIGLDVERKVLFDRRAGRLYLVRARSPERILRYRDVQLGKMTVDWKYKTMASTAVNTGAWKSATSDIPRSSRSFI